MTLFNTNFKKRISHWDKTMKENKSFTSPIQIELIKANHEEDMQFVTFANHFTDITPHCNFETKQSDAGLPGFRLNNNILFSALPLERELDPFLETLTAIGTNDINLSPHLKQQLDMVDIPVNLTLFIALQCPHCPGVVKTVIPLALYCKNIKLHIIDGSLFSQTAQTFKVMSAPCLILEEDFRWTGSVADEEIVQMIMNRDPSKLSADTLKSILEDGDASWISKQMMEKQTLFDGFIELILHETWSVRLGTMVVIEEIAESDPELASKLCPILISRYDDQDITVQGDILYALGEAGDSDTKNWLMNKLSQMDDKNLMEAAQDALESLEIKYPASGSGV